MYFRRATRSWRRRALVLAAVLASAAAVLSSTNAQASTAAVLRPLSIQAPLSLNDCPAHSFCLWQNYSYNNYGAGGFWAYDYNTNPHLEWLFVGAEANDQASSLYNNRAYKVGINKDANPPSALNKLCLGGGTQDSLLTEKLWPDNTEVNDSISAIWFSQNSTDCGAGF